MNIISLFHSSICYIECVRKMITKFSFIDCTISDLGMLVPHNHYHISYASSTRLVQCFYKKCSIEDMDMTL